MLFYKNDTIWSVCYDEFEDVSYIYHGSIDDNKNIVVLIMAKK